MGSTDSTSPLQKGCPRLGLGTGSRMATPFPVGTTAHTKAKEAAKKLADWIKNNTTPTTTHSQAGYKGLVLFRNKENHQNIAAGINSGLYYYEGYDPFETAFDLNQPKGPWRNLVEVDENWKPTGKFY